MDYIGYIGMILAIVGTYINARGKRTCFYFWIGSNVLFASLSVLASQWPQTGLFTYNLAMCFVGLKKWR